MKVPKLDGAQVLKHRAMEADRCVKSMKTAASEQEHWDER